jgi:uncharacterized membrane protein
MERSISQILAAVLLAVSAFVIALKLVQPASLNVYVGPSGNATLVSSIPGIYSFDDMLVVFISALVTGASATFILTSGREPSVQPLGEVVLSERRAKWAEVSKSLKDDEMKVYQAVLEAGGVLNQGDLITQLGLSKTTISRTLDLLESKGLIEKRRRGMGNVILLK